MQSNDNNRYNPFKDDGIYVPFVGEEYIARKETDEDGTEHFFLKIVGTGAESEVSREVINVFSADERKNRRDYQENKERGFDISTDAATESERNVMLSDHNAAAEDINYRLLVSDFSRELTANQLEVFEYCMLGKMSFSAFSKLKGITRQSVKDIVVGIRKKAKKFLGDTLQMRKK